MDGVMNNIELQRVFIATVGYLEDISQAFFFRNAYFGAGLLGLFLYFGPVYFCYGVAASLIGYGYTLLYSMPKILRDSGLVTLNSFFFGM